jgi:hypothetical protein
MQSFARGSITKSFFRSGNPYNPPCSPLKNGGNYKELQEKSPFEKGGFIAFAKSLFPLSPLPPKRVEREL